MLEREAATERLRAAKEASTVTFEDLADAVGPGQFSLISSSVCPAIFWSAS